MQLVRLRSPDPYAWNEIEKKLVAKPSDYHASGVPNWLLH